MSSGNNNVQNGITQKTNVSIIRGDMETENWFINSPLDHSEPTGINHVIDLLNTNLSLHFIIC